MPTHMLEGSDFPLSENPRSPSWRGSCCFSGCRSIPGRCVPLGCPVRNMRSGNWGGAGGSDRKEAAWLRRIGLDCPKRSALALGCWLYDSNDKAAGENASTRQNPHFITLTEWKERYAAWREERLPQLQDQAREAAERGMKPEAAARWAQVPAGLWWHAAGGISR